MIDWQDRAIPKRKKYIDYVGIHVLGKISTLCYESNDKIYQERYGLTREQYLEAILSGIVEDFKVVVMDMASTKKMKPEFLEILEEIEKNGFIK